MMKRNDQNFSPMIQKFQRHMFCLANIISMGLLLLSLLSCAQQSDLTRAETDIMRVEKDIAKLNKEKKKLDQILIEANKAIEESQEMLVRQKSELSGLVRARAQFKSELKSLREEDLTQLIGDLDTASHQLRRLGGTVDELAQKVESIDSDLNARDQARAEEISNLHQNVQKEFDQQNGTMSKNLASLRSSLVEFKDVMTEIDKRLVAEKTRAFGAETDMKNDFDARQAAFQEKLDSDTKTLKEFFETNLKMSISSVAKTLEDVNAALIAQLDSQRVELNSQATLLSNLNAKVEAELVALAQALEISDARSKQMEIQAAALSKKLEADTRVFREYLDKDVRISLQAMAEATSSNREQTQAQVALQAQRVKDLSQSVVSMKELLDSMASMLGKRSDEQMQQLGKLSAGVEQMEQAQSSVLSKQDDNVQTLSVHINEITTSLKSVVNSLDQVKNSLTSRLDQQGVRLADQEERLTETANNLLSREKVKQELFGIVQHLNQLTKAFGQLKEDVQGKLVGLAQQMKQLQSTNPSALKP